LRQVLIAVGEERVTALREVEWERGVESRRQVGEERGRFARQPAVQRRAPLLPHAAWLDARGAGCDSFPLDDERLEPGFCKMEGHRQAGDPGADHHDLGAGGRH